MHTELAGVNAFFVRADLADRFDEKIWAVPRRSHNYYGHGHGHPEHPGGGRLAWIHRAARSVPSDL